MCADTARIVLDDTLPVSAVVVRSAPRVAPAALRARYEDLRLLGQGGVGVVFRARDPRLGRDVALKLLKHADPELRAHFLNEARVQARVDHEHVCHIYEVGEADGEPFIAMQLVDGEPLWRMQRRLSVAQKVEVVRAIASAVHEAHVLGLVHRDIKPGNILVEARKDGSLKPYIMDFGLAREIARDARATAGAALGTPAYMAPEQALGAPVDRRADIYSLGATLYELLAGRPPYVDDNPWKILARIDVEEPPPLRELRRGVPADLEAIVMKCLERDPARRYGSAQALAEDLRRFLDGAAVEARRWSRASALWRAVRRHKVVAAVAIAGLLLAEGWIEARREVTAQAWTAQELGREGVAMELLMRSAYQMPLHDVERERAMVRERLAWLEQRLPHVELQTVGALHYAIGRGRLAIGEAGEAREHLERAKAAGYAPPELDYALGLAWIELARQRRAQVNDIADAPRREAVLDDIERRYWAPALSHLRAAHQAQIESPAYAEALIARYEGRLEDVVVKAREAFARSPLLFEAKRLEGDALAELALREWQGGRSGWWEAMSARLEEAVAAYRAAEDIARSDPLVLERSCGLGTRAMYAARFHGDAPRPSFLAAREVCERAVRADGSSAKALNARANLYALYAYAIAEDPQPGDAPQAVVEEALRLGEGAVRASGGSVEAMKTLGTALRARISLEMREGRDAGATIRRAIEHYERVIEVAPRHGELHESLATVYRWQARLDRWQGRDPGPAVAQGLRCLDEALAGGVGRAMVHNKRALLLLERAHHELDSGRAPREAALRALLEVEAGAAIGPSWSGFDLAAAEAHLILAAYATSAGADQRAPLAAAEEAARRAAGSESHAALAQELLDSVALEKARSRIRERRDAAEIDAPAAGARAGSGGRR